MPIDDNRGNDVTHVLHASAARRTHHHAPQPTDTTTMQHHENRSKGSRSGVRLGLFLSTLTAIAVSLAAPRFSDVLTAFGADIPLLSGALIRGFWWIWLLPALVLLAWFAWPVVRQRNAAALGVGIFSFLVVLPVCVVALYLPIFKLGATV